MAEPLPQRRVPFYGDELVAVQQADGAIFVLFSRLCDNLGITREAQVRRVQRHAVLQEGLVVLDVQTEGGPQSAQALRLDLLPLWMSGLNARKVKADVQEKLVRYQKEAATVLWQAFRPQILVAIPTAPATNDQAMVHLQQIAELGRAITQMAEQQMELQRQQQTLTVRMNTAARVIKDFDVRLTVLEDKLQPAAYVTDAQATEVSNAVKALAELLTGTDTTKNHYQSIFAELYRRFSVSSYKLIRQDQYTAVLQFLAEWRAALIA